ncbi:uncharacterized protein LOC113664880 [Pocillopora damicornis]|uniref:uncharacterized protein LOC113664880 n=1 Tax=Pocillopora damicornis TaxID=46731 RepID=UPI000F54D7C2|nr:uncharacterized protein LOC113664880 [Pocillopora damicornis]
MSREQLIADWKALCFIAIFFTGQSVNSQASGISYPVLTGQQLRLWYGDDLKGSTESDSRGTVYCDVYALFVTGAI